MNDDQIEVVIDGIWSPNEPDANGEPSNIVDGLFAIARAIERLAPVVSEREAPVRDL